MYYLLKGPDGYIVHDTNVAHFIPSVSSDMCSCFKSYSAKWSCKSLPANPPYTLIAQFDSDADLLTKYPELFI